MRQAKGSVMNDLIQCPNCATTLRRPSAPAGSVVRCPHCSGGFLSPPLPPTELYKAAATPGPNPPPLPVASPPPPQTQCPVCQAVLRVPPGTKTACPQCGQRVLVPYATQAKTVLAKSLSAPAQVPAPVTIHSPPAAPRPPSRRWIAWAVVGGALLVVAVCAAVVIQSSAKPALPTAPAPVEKKEGETWSHQELAGHLRSHGMPVTVKRTDFGSFWGPAAYFVFEGDTSDERVREVNAGLNLTGVVYVRIHKTAQEAKDQAGTAPDKCFAWGRFLFQGDPRWRAKVKDSLPKQGEK